MKSTWIPCLCLKELENLSSAVAYISACLCLPNATFPIQIFLGLKDSLPREDIQKVLDGQVGSTAQLTGADQANGAASVRCFVGCIICNWGWPEWENFGSIHRKWIFPDWLIPLSIFLSTTKTFGLVCSCPGPPETEGGFVSLTFQLVPNVSGAKSEMHRSFGDVASLCLTQAAQQPNVSESLPL